MKADPAAIDALLARFPGAKVMGMPSGEDHVAGGGKVIGSHIVDGNKKVGRRPNVRKVGPNGENKTELDYYRKYLEPRLLAGELVAVEFEAVRFNLTPSFGPKMKAQWYKTDFYVTTHQGIEIHEIKGAYTERHARKTIKEFLTRYPYIAFFLCVKGAQGWDVERVGRG